jgi:type I restriction enzyme S subunit
MKWKSCLVGDFVDEGLAEIQTGPFGTQLRASDYVSDGTPVINVRNIGLGDLRPDKVEFVGEETKERLSAHLLAQGDIVFGRKGAVDRHLFVQAEQDKWMQGSDCIRLRFLTDQIRTRFVSYAFLRKEHQQWMLAQSGNKATMASLNQDIIRRIPLVIPPPDIQERVVGILSAYDDLIENNRRRMALLEESARLLYREWFVRLHFPGHEHTPIVNGLPEGWERKPLGQITTKIGSGATPRGGEAAYLNAGIPLIRSLNVYDDRFDDDGLAFIGEDQAAALAHVTVESRDILLNITGASVARCCMAPERYLPARVNQHVMIIRINPEEADPFFIHAAINSDERKRQLLSYAQKGSTREALTKDMMESFEITVPHAVVMRQLGEIAACSFQQRENLALQNQRLKAARDLLLPRLMSGEIAI